MHQKSFERADRVFIGMPVFNGSRFIRDAIDSILSQTFTHWVLLISDNFSTDETGEICLRYCQEDPRLSYVKQPQNLGAVQNFKFLLEKASSEYFMWMACDDVLHPEYLGAAIANLDRCDRIGMFFSNIVNIDGHGAIVRRYPSMNRLSGEAGIKTVIRYVMSPEVMGKANLFYSVVRLPLYQLAWKASPLREEMPCSDMSFVLAALSRGGIAIDERVLFHKRYVRPDDTLDQPHEVQIGSVWRHHLHPKEFLNHFVLTVNALRGTNLALITCLAMMFRFMEVVAGRILLKVESLLMFRSHSG